MPTAPALNPMLSSQFMCIDLETGDLDPRTGEIYEIAAIPSHPKAPPFHAFVYHGTHLTITPWSIKNLDWSRYRDLAPKLPECDEHGTWHVPKDRLFDQFERWAREEAGFMPHAGTPGNGLVVGAGKNFAGFDLQFLITLDKRFCPQRGSFFCRRSLDPVTLYTTKDDRLPPNLAECLRRAGIKPSKAHSAMDDARAVLALLRAKGF